MTSGRQVSAPEGKRPSSPKLRSEEPATASLTGAVFIREASAMVTFMCQLDEGALASFWLTTSADVTAKVFFRGN